MKETKNLMHVGLEQPKEKRKDILNSAIGTIEILKRYERFKKLKKESDAQKKELRAIMKEVKTLFKELEESMPVVELPKEAPKKAEPQKVEIKQKPKERIVIKPAEIKKDPHVAKLEKDLKALKDKISSI